MIKKIACTAVLITALLAGNVFNAFAAASFSDVASSHWAYTSIVSMADKGIIVGDSSGKYYPDKIIDKFEISKIFARAAGFKYINLTEAEKLFNERAFKANESTLKLFKKAFTKWDSTADSEISFLLEKEILSVDDLNRFVLKMTDGTEKLTGSSKEEMTMFITRMLGETSKALSYNIPTTGLFSDDAAISATYKKYVYYLKSIGLINGDTNNNFNPKSGATKAWLAVLLNNALYVKSGGVITPPASTNTSTPPTDNTNTQTTPAPDTNTNTNTNTSPPDTSSNATKIESISGQIDMLYSPLNAIQITSTTGTKNIYAMSATVTIYVDGFLKTFADLKTGMTVMGIVSDTKIIELRAQTTTTLPITTTPVTNTDVNNQQLSKIEGIVSTLNLQDTVYTIGIEVRMLSPKGDIIPEIKTYALTTDCSVKRSGTAINFNEILIGDIVSGGISGNKIYTINVEEKNLKIIGTLSDKKYSSTNVPILTVQSSEGKKYDLRVPDSAVINRKLTGDIKWTELRIGDKVDVEAEYDQVIKIYAEGTITTKEGWLEAIYISKDMSSITISDTNKTVTTHRVLPGLFDIYTLKIGAKLRVRLDSEEVENVFLLEAAKQESLTATIDAVRADHIIVSNSALGISSKQIFFNATTIITDAVTATRTNSAFLVQGMQVYITYDTAASIVAKAITVLSR